MKKELKRIKEILEILEETKPLFSELDRLTEILIQDGFKEEKVGEKILMLKDNFSEKNTMFKPAAFKRFEVVFKRGEK